MMEIAWKNSSVFKKCDSKKALGLRKMIKQGGMDAYHIKYELKR